MNAPIQTLQRGFTLLEVMISLAILAVGLVAISDLNGGAVAMHAYARRATEATLLLKGKMLDIEDQLHKDGFHDFDDEKHGTFEDDGAPDYTWSAEILKPDVQLDPAQLLSMLGVGDQGKKGSSSSSGTPGGIAGAASSLAQALQGSGGIGAGGIAGALQGGGAAAMMSGPLAGILQGQAKTFIETLKKSVREVRLTVSWQDGKQRRSVSASQEIVILPESVGKAGQTAGVQQLQQGGLVGPGQQGGLVGPGQPLPGGGVRLPPPPSSDPDAYQ
jgi:general secretion pathway protein I